MAVANWVKNLTEEVMGPSKMEIGKVIKHPDGRMVKVTGGRLWGEHGLSNWWYWQEVKKDGKLGPQEEGYGW